MRSRLVVAACGGALVVGAPTAAWASAAPPGTASGSAVDVGAPGQPIASVSKTQASSGSGGGQASADVLSLGGQTVVGGSSSGSGSHSGNLVDTGSSNPGRVQVGPWSATSGATSAASTSAVAAASLGDPSSSQSASVTALQSRSSSSYNPSQSGGQSSNDGLIVDVGGPGGLVLDLLHSDASSTGQGSAYLVGVNGTRIGDNSQVGTICKNLNVPSVVGLSCLQVSGGVGSLLAQVAGVNLGSGTSTLNAGLLTSTAGSAPGGLVSLGSSAPAATTSARGADTPAAADSPAPAGQPTNGGSSLPFTGAPIELLVFAGIALLSLGGVTVKAVKVVAPGALG